MSMYESVTEFPEVLPPYFPSPHLLICESLGVVVVVCSCGGTDSGIPKLFLDPILSSPFL